MQVLRRVAETQRLSERVRCAGERIALVPTMGALHRGHRALLAEARGRADRAWVSIFVNPTQFDAASDLESYPRNLEEDLAVCREEGVDVVFAPSEEELYPAGAQTWVEVVDLSRPLCGAARPGHFRGVATVVTKLLLATRPHLAVFGHKDHQQLAVVRRLVRDLCLDVEVVGVPTVREPDGLALSSRNVHLGPETRRQARVLVRALRAAQAAGSGGEQRRDVLLALVEREIAKAPLARLDYAELRDPDTLEPAPSRLSGPTLLALAVRFPCGEGRTVRLIDNCVLHPRAAEEEGT